MYNVEGTAYADEASALAAARELSEAQGRAVKVERGDSTLGISVTATWVGGEPTLVAPNEELEPVDRSERLAKKFEADPDSPPVPRLED